MLRDAHHRGGSRSETKRHGRFSCSFNWLCKTSPFPRFAQPWRSSKCSVERVPTIDQVGQKLPRGKTCTHRHQCSVDRRLMIHAPTIAWRALAGTGSHWPSRARMTTRLAAYTNSEWRRSPTSVKMSGLHARSQHGTPIGMGGRSNV